jgi:hypothetical protein
LAQKLEYFNESLRPSTLVVRGDCRTGGGVRLSERWPPSNLNISLIVVDFAQRKFVNDVSFGSEVRISATTLPQYLLLSAVG